MQIKLICIFINMYENIENVIQEWGSHQQNQ